MSNLSSSFVTNIREGARMPDYVLTGMLSTYDGKTYEVIAIFYGENGYRPTSWGRQTREWIAKKNAELDIDPATQAAYYNCSVFNCWESYKKVFEGMMNMLCKCTNSIRPDDPDCPVHGKIAHWVDGGE